MPKQETFFEEQSGDRRIEVLKSNDQSYAREAFKNMDEEAQQRLWQSLRLLCCSVVVALNQIDVALDCRNPFSNAPAPSRAA